MSTTTAHQCHELAQELAALLAVIDRLTQSGGDDLTDAMEQARALAAELCSQLATEQPTTSSTMPRTPPEEMPDADFFDFIAYYGDGDLNTEAEERFRAWRAHAKEKQHGKRT